MKPLRVIGLLGIAVLLIQFLGCSCSYKRGITVRGGFDFRERLKPSGFVEIVDTEWDESRRDEDLRWLQNSGHSDGHSDDHCLNTDTSFGTSQGDTVVVPDLGMPILKSPSTEEEEEEESSAPVSPPVPESISLPDDEPMPFDSKEAGEPPPMNHSEEGGHHHMAEQAGFRSSVQSLTNQPASIKPSSSRHHRSRRASRERSWLWSKP